MMIIRGYGNEPSRIVSDPGTVGSADRLRDHRSSDRDIGFQQRHGSTAAPMSLTLPGAGFARRTTSAVRSSVGDTRPGEDSDIAHSNGLPI